MHDYTVNGVCSNCNKCCMEYVAINKREIKEIKEYIKKNNVGKINHYDKAGRFRKICPFRDDENEKCTIYPVRPLLCRIWMCDIDFNKEHGYEKEVAEIFESQYNIRDRQKKSFHELFYNDLDWEIQYNKNRL